MTRNKPKLLFFVTEDWYFCSHRLALAKTAQQAGFEVSVLTRVDQHGEVIKNEGIKLIPLDFARGGINPIRELRTLWRVRNVYRTCQPDIVHHVALKPVLYGGIVTLFMPGLKVVNLLAGLGTVFSSRQWQVLLLQPLVKLLFRVLFRRANVRTIVQNREDYALLRDRLQIPVSLLKLIKGSGVNTQQFLPAGEPPEPVSIALVSRLLWDKGIGEYVAAVKLLKLKGYQFDAYLVGRPDSENVGSISNEQLQAWDQEGYVHCLGHIEKIAGFWQKVHIAALPSYYGEGVPKCLIEAAACQRPIITSDTAGCLEIVEDGVNGMVVPARNVNALADAIEKLIVDGALRRKMGEAGREKVKQEFSDAIVLLQTLAVYRELI